MDLNRTLQAMARNGTIHLALMLLGWFALVFTASSRDLNEIRSEGVLRHLAIPYANFDTGRGDGLDVELIQGFARELGVEYQRVETGWVNAIADLTGLQEPRTEGPGVELGPPPVRGDLIASGMTVLDWRKELVEFSEPTFPTAIWLVARADSKLWPIEPTGDLVEDIRRVRAKLSGHSLLGMPETCLDPKLYDLAETGARIILHPSQRSISEMVPALLNRDAETALLDLPDALMAMQRWSGQIKVIGPIAGNQRMAVAFRKGAPALREAFNDYLGRLREDGSYRRLVQKYYPTIFGHFHDFFRQTVED